MKITVYELIGMVKDGKQPKKIKYKNKIYEFNTNEYGTGYLGNNEWLSNEFEIDDVNDLNDEIEIIEEKENNKIEKIPIGKYKPTHRIKKIEKKINELIDVINELRGKDEGRIN